MEAFIVGLLYILLGIVLLFFGARFMKVVIGILGGLIGINIGQVLVAWWGFDNVWAFLPITICALGVGALAVMFYKIFIAASVGYLMAVVAYNLLMSWNVAHTLAIILGLVLGAAVFVAVNRLDLVEVAFKFMTSVQGAIVLVSGLYLLFHSIRIAVFQTNYYDVLLGASAWWVVLWLVAFAAGFGYQLRTENEALTKV